MRDWQGKTYWLVGASEGLGRELALLMSRTGATLVLTARNADRLAALQAELPGPSRIEVADVGDSAAMRAAAARIGPVDGLVYMAGVGQFQHPGDWNADEAETMANVNFTGALRAVGAVLPDMVARGHGHIVLTGSLSAYRGVPGMAVYGATKAALNSLAESLQADLRESDVEVQVINPGYIRTAMTAANTGPMPFLMEPEAAARVYFEAMNSGVAKRAFPAPISWAVRIGQLLPDWLYQRTIGKPR